MPDDEEGKGPSSSSEDEAAKKFLEDPWQAPKPSEIGSSREIWEYDYEKGKPSRELVITLTLIIAGIVAVLTLVLLALNRFVG